LESKAFVSNPAISKVEHLDLGRTTVDAESSAVLAQIGKILVCADCRGRVVPMCVACYAPDCARLRCRKCLETKEKSSKGSGTECGACHSTMRESRAIVGIAMRFKELEEGMALEQRSKTTECKGAMALVDYSQHAIVPEFGDYGQNLSRACEVITADAKERIFKTDKPKLEISEPAEYFCPSTHKLAYFNETTGMWCAEGEPMQATADGGAAQVEVPHFSSFSAQSTRFKMLLSVNLAFFDEHWDYDFTNTNDSGTVHRRGLEIYRRPVGYYRCAIKVAGKFADEKWLGSGTDASVWPVTYHGPGYNAVVGILQSGLHTGGTNGLTMQNGAAYGAGIYTTPDHKGAEFWGQPVVVGGHTYRCVFQARVRNGGFRKTGPSGNYWVVASPADVRCYGLLVRQES